MRSHVSGKLKSELEIFGMNFPLDKNLSFIRKVVTLLAKGVDEVEAGLLVSSSLQKSE